MKTNILILLIFVFFGWGIMEKIAIAYPLATSNKRDKTNTQSLPQLIEKVEKSLEDLGKKIKASKEAGVDISKFQEKFNKLKKSFDTPIDQSGFNPIELYKHILDESTEIVKSIDKNINTRKKDNKPKRTAKSREESNKTNVNANADDKAKTEGREAGDKKTATDKDKISLILNELGTIQTDLTNLKKRIEGAYIYNRDTRSKLTGKITSMVYLVIFLFLLSCGLSVILGWFFGQRTTQKVLEKAGLL